MHLIIEIYSFSVSSPRTHMALGFILSIWASEHQAQSALSKEELINVQLMGSPSKINFFRHKYAKARDYVTLLDSQIDLFSTYIISHITSSSVLPSSMS